MDSWSGDDTHAAPQDTIVFDLKAKCVPNPDAAKDSILPEDVYSNRNVYTKQLKWEPIGEQETLFAHDPPRPVHDDILIAKLAPGQELDLKLLCVKGIGRDHAKFSPVCTAFYRFLPTVQLLDKIGGADAIKLQTCFSPGVIELDKTGNACVHDARYDSTSRNVFLYPELKDRVKLGFKKDHFICESIFAFFILTHFNWMFCFSKTVNVESTGALTSKEIVLQSIDVLIAKCRKHLDELDVGRSSKSDKNKKDRNRTTVESDQVKRLYWLRHEKSFLFTDSVLPWHFVHRFYFFDFQFSVFTFKLN